MNNLLRITTVLAASSALCGCAVMDSIHWSFPGPGDSRVITVDAKQRHLIMTQDLKNQVRACAEPAPETFAAYSSSFAGLLGIAPDKREAQASSATGETVASLERTQTVNLLREMLYRTCERWLSGALDQAQFLTLSARDHRSMVAVLAVEQLTGVVKPPSTIISGPAVNAAIKQTEKLVELLSKYMEERIAAETVETTANSDSAKVNEDYTSDGKTVKLCSLVEKPTDDTWGPKWEKCKPAADKAKAAKQVAQAARDREQSVLDQLENLSGGPSGGTKQGQQSSSQPENGQDGAGRIPTRATGTDLEHLAKAVTDIALSPGIDETLMFCISYLHRPSIETDLDTRATCNRIIVENANRDLRKKESLYGFGPSASAVMASVGRIMTYEDFQTDIQSLVARTPAERWKEFWTPFAALLTTTQGLDCSNAEKCAAVWNTARPYYRDFSINGDQLQQAAETWSLELTAIGR